LPLGHGNAGLRCRGLGIGSLAGGAIRRDTTDDGAANNSSGYPRDGFTLPFCLCAAMSAQP